MPVPEYQILMLPILRIAGDQQEHHMMEVRDDLANQFSLSGSERAELLPSGRQTRFDNRVAWARTYLTQARLLETTGRGKFRVTTRGLEALKSDPPEINNAYLNRFPEFREFRHPSRQDDANAKTAVLIDQTPREVLESSYHELRGNLTQEVLDMIKKCSPSFFEQLVVDLLVAMGYGGDRREAGQAIGGSHDAGVDGVIKEDKLGLDAVYIQAKRWDSTVSRPVVQGFSGSLDGVRARKGVLITTSRFSKEALEYIELLGDKKIVLIDGERLASLMIDHGLGVTEETTYVVNKIDFDYFAV